PPRSEQRLIVPHELQAGERGAVLRRERLGHAELLPSRRGGKYRSSPRRGRSRYRHARFNRSSTSSLSLGSVLMTMLYCRVFFIAAIGCETPNFSPYATRLWQSPGMPCWPGSREYPIRASLIKWNRA